jgi:hypothetical protein
MAVAEMVDTTIMKCLGMAATVAETSFWSAHYPVVLDKNSTYLESIAARTWVGAHRVTRT